MTLPPALRVLLWPASLVFQGLVRLRTGLYRRQVFQQRRLNGMVISVGNLTVGGTGKTPLVLWIAERLADEGRRVGILIRGYRGVRQADERGVPLSDEVALLRGRLGSKAQFGVGADRYATAQVLERHGVDWFVLDDGFQHLRLARNVDIVLIDATDPFGGGYLLPAGRLREPRSALGRSDVVVITRSEHAPAIEAIVRRHTLAPIFYVQTELGGVFPVPQALGPQMAEWREKRFFAFCAIGNPAAFFDDLRRWGIRVVGEYPFGDHHLYTPRDAVQIELLALAAGAEALLCTEKDVFNLRRVQFKGLPAYFCRVELKISDAEKFWQAVTETVQRSRAAAKP